MERWGEKPSPRWAVIAAALVCAMTLAFPAAAPAEVFNVTSTTDDFDEPANDGTCGLREAVEAANTDSDFGGCLEDDTFPLDLIQLPAPSYVLTRDGVDDTNSAGDLDILNEGVSILGQNTSGPTTIDGNADDADPTDDRVIEVHPSAADGATQDFGATGLVIRDGATTGGGGGINLNGPPNADEDFTVSIGLVTFTNNKAFSGGAIENESGTTTMPTPENLRVIDSTISGNSVESNGGGINTIGPGTRTRLENVTISNNTADTDTGGGSGGGIAAAPGSTYLLHNTIVAGNFDNSAAGIVAPDCIEQGMPSGVIDSVNHNLIGSTAGPCGIDVGTADKQNVPAGLAGLANIPGAGLSTVLAHDLLAGSQARDAGNPAAVGGAVGTCATLAQNFGPRPIDGDGDGVARCDMGSVEADPAAPGGGSGGGSGGGTGSSPVRCSGKTVTIAGARATISGTAGNDTINGTPQSDVIDGAEGNDTIRGGGGNDVICGDAGKDNLVGGGGKDRLLGGAGKDKLKGGGGKDTCIGAGARDRASACEKAKSI